MLPFFFRHYDSIVDHYFIYDNYSSDNSLEILGNHPKVTVLPFDVDGDSIVEAASAQVDQMWQRSRGNADWTAVCNIDEFFWHIDLRWYLRECQRRGVTFLQAQGYQMVSDAFPDPRANLPKACRMGARFQSYDKAAFFDPNAIEEMRFAVARHSCAPVGRVFQPEHNEVLLLHYKYLGRGYVRERHQGTELATTIG